ncbi:outer membrane receptor FepA [Citrobacter amalonaticus]|nr:outer membrane receptor FepA [Citrobacter amalonaticus]
MNTITKISPRPLALLIATALSGNAFAADDVLNDGETMVVQATAEEALKQQPGVSIITAKDIEKSPTGQRPLRYYSHHARCEPDGQQRQRQSGK